MDLCPPWGPWAPPAGVNRALLWPNRANSLLGSLCSCWDCTPLPSGKKQKESVLGQGKSNKRWESLTQMHISYLSEGPSKLACFGLADLPVVTSLGLVWHGPALPALPRPCPTTTAAAQLLLVAEGSRLLLLDQAKARQARQAQAKPSQGKAQQASQPRQGRGCILQPRLLGTATFLAGAPDITKNRDLGHFRSKQVSKKS